MQLNYSDMVPQDELKELINGLKKYTPIVQSLFS